MTVSTLPYRKFSIPVKNTVALSSFPKISIWLTIAIIFLLHGATQTQHPGFLVVVAKPGAIVRGENDLRIIIPNPTRSEVRTVCCLYPTILDYYSYSMHPVN